MTALTIALAGNPNCGKSTLFNALTGSHQRVGNWPGVTVDCKSGSFTLEQQAVKLVDLPGTYSLVSAELSGAMDEQTARDYILSQQTDVILNVVDASHLERHLYLTTQLLELGRPLILVVNMIDVAKRRGHQINFRQLQRELGCPVVPVLAHQGRGIDHLKRTLMRIQKKSAVASRLVFPPAVEQTIKGLGERGVSRVQALRLLEGDSFAAQHIDLAARDYLNTQQTDINQQCQEDADIILADARFGFVHDVCQKAIQRVAKQADGISARIDRVVLNRLLGIPIFLLVMYALFFFAINIGGAFQDFFDITTNALFVQGLGQLLTNWGCPAWLTAIIAKGAGKGINTTVTFIPVIGSMYFFLAVLEASGYMARATFVVDRSMRAMGLPGQAFIPLIVGFGCNVPGIMATRHLENRRDRILTILMSPFMSCSARLAIFAVFITAFFPSGGHNLVFALYVIGIAMALLTGFILRRTLLQGQAAPLLLELPAYHLPRLKPIVFSTWARLRHFLWRAGKVIIPVCLVIGALNALSIHGTLITGEVDEQSLLSAIGRWLTPLFAPMGMKADNWPATVGLITGGLAKEVVIGTLNTLYTQMGHLTANQQTFNLWASLSAALQSVSDNLSRLPSALMNPILASAPEQEVNAGVYGVMYQHFAGQVGAFAYLLFVLLYMPCVSTIAAIRRELNRGWMWFSVVWSLLLAYGAGVLFYQLATWRHHPLSSSLWIIGMLSVFALFITALRLYGQMNRQPSLAYEQQGVALS